MELPNYSQVIGDAHKPPINLQWPKGLTDGWTLPLFCFRRNLGEVAIKLETIQPIIRCKLVAMNLIPHLISFPSRRVIDEAFTILPI